MDQCLLDTDRFAHYIGRFAGLYPEEVVNAVPDREAWDWLRGNVPFFECSHAAIEEIYWFRWWIYRKHLRRTPDGYVVTEFLPDVRHGGKHNTINCAVGHQLYEGRWIASPEYLDDYTRFMLERGGNLHAYSCWFADAVWQRYCVTGDRCHAAEVLEGLVAYYRKWEEKALAGGLFRYTPWMDGMEFSISGNQDERCRPTLNSYMYGDAQAIAKFAALAGKTALEAEFAGKAAVLKRQIQERLWHSGLSFFATQDPDGKWMPPEQPVREQIGYIPWYFNMPDGGYERAWSQLADPEGFQTPVGLASAEIRHPSFLKMNPERLPTWDGPVWPFATSQTLVALQNLLRNYGQSYVASADYVRELGKYAASHVRDGKPSISEVLRDPRVAQMGGSEHYNHSTFCDLVITGLAGLVPREDASLEVAPLCPLDWDYFCLDGVPYRGRRVTIAWDRTGERYGKRGLRIYVDHELRHEAADFKRIQIPLVREK